jgi:hypothetical protein
MSPLEQARRWWQEYTGEEETPIDGDTPAWVVSLLIHVVVLLGLALAGLAAQPKTARPITIIQPTELVEDEVLMVPDSFAVSTEVPQAVGAESQQSADVAEALAPTLSEQSVVPVEPDQELISDLHMEPVDSVPTGQQFDATVVVKGAVGVGTTGASGAVDRLTAEIASSLEQRATLVCWLFDQSVSLSAQRKEIASRLERVFDELGANRSEQNRPDLTNIVVAFGKDASVVTKKPTSDASVVVSAIESIPIDDSGAEMTFGAIRRAAEEVKVFRTNSPRKNVMIIVFTDEVGNDQKEADQTGQVCRTFGIPVYVVGVPAPFGMREVKMKYVEFDPKFDQDVQWARIEQGPESLYPEMVRVRSGRFADEAIDSGFGPFSLSKLCGETGGIYFCVHANRNARGRVSDAQTAAMSSQLRYFFDHDVMRSYQPDYVSAAKIDQMLMANRAKRALVEAAQKSEISPMESPEMTFPRQDDGQLAMLLGEAQKVAAKIQPKIDALHAVLAAGAVDREKIQEKRWQAGYDLAMGRVLAVKVRTDAYNLMLAQAKTGMKFKNAGSDTWQLEPSDDVTVGSQTEKIAKQATTYLERVVREHAGTPWALLAGEELRQPLGYKWTEAYTGVNKPKVDAGGGNAGALPDDKRRMVAPPKPKRDLKNL